MFRKVQRLVKLSLLLKFQPSGCDSLTNQWLLRVVALLAKLSAVSLVDGSANHLPVPHPATATPNPKTTTASPSHFMHFILIASFCDLC
jgi:hypothetical protein